MASAVEERVLWLRRPSTAFLPLVVSPLRD